MHGGGGAKKNNFWLIDDVPPSFTPHLNAFGVFDVSFIEGDSARTKANAGDTGEWVNWFCK
jgi:hypothetical protein